MVTSRTLNMPQRGFTLIEILLVLVLMAVVSAIIAPSFFAASGSTPALEARLMQKMLRMASEESQLDGRPVQIRVFSDHLSLLEHRDKNGWQPLRSDVLEAEYRLPSPVRIASAALDADLSPLTAEQDKPISRAEKPPLARFLLMPDGNLTAGHITLDSGSGTDAVSLRLQPGPGGIGVES